MDTMKESDFEQLWQRAEAARYADKLAGEYEGWRQHRRHMVVAVAGAALVAVTTLPLLLHQSAPKDYEQVVCNRTGTTDAQWASLAAELLIES